MKRAITIICLILLVGALLTVSLQEYSATSVTVNLLGQGAVRGCFGRTAWTNQTIMQFMGIPYAESPSGPLRFKPPVARLPWRYIYDATQTPRRCPVITTVEALSPNELKNDLEDCLNLSVYTKNLTAKQPVMVKLYGGGFYNGTAVDHPPGFLLEKDVVLVVPHNRIGALGWATTLKQEMPGNVPIMDIQIALEWVQRHIGSFGGDPNQVTVFGQSAGATLAGAVLVSPKTQRHHISRLITQSGSILATWAINPDPHGQTVKICRDLKCANCDTDDGVHECLREATVIDLLKVCPVNEVSFAPIVGDYHGVLPQHPKLLAAKIKHPIPFMTGFTKHDGSFVLASYWEALKATVGDLSKMTVRKFAGGIIDFYRDTSGLAHNLLSRMLFTPDQLNSHDHKNVLPAYFDLTSLLFLKSPIIALSNEMIDIRLADVYVYSFDYEGEHTRFGYEMGNAQYPFNGGVHHSDDNIYLFPTHPLNANDTAIAQQMVEIFTSFAIEGRPRCISGTPIPSAKSESGPFFHIDSAVSVGNDVLSTLTAALDDPHSDKLDRKHIEF